MQILKNRYNQKEEIIPIWIKKGDYEVSLDKYYTYPKTIRSLSFSSIFRRG